MAEPMTGPFAGVRAVADAVLYEGYLLYPYRASAQKNRSRWQFGVLMPDGYADPSERAYLQAEMVVAGEVAVTGLVRFLQVQRRTDAGSTWDEAVPHEIPFTATDLPYEYRFEVPGGLAAADGVGRRRAPLSGAVTVTARPLPGPWRASVLRVRVDNRTPLPPTTGRDGALPAALLACHVIVALAGGTFVSMVDPPEWAAPTVAECVNTGTWPVLAGPPGRHDVMLCAPIILYDHPEIAPESPGDLFDATEIDEILSLRTLALTEDEKREARATDPRAAALLDRTESLDATAWGRLHGALRPVAAPDTPWWDPEADASVDPATDSVVVAGRRVAAGTRVRLRPGARRADAQDMFLAGRLAVVEAVLQDVDDNAYLAVTLADDPAADVQRSHGRFLYFAPDEVEPCDG